MRGRKPKPLAQKLLEGNPGKRPIDKSPDTMEPQAPISGVQPPPAYLGKHARAHWQHMAPHLVAMKTLTDVDWAHLEAMCEFHEDRIAARLELAEVRGSAKRRTKAYQERVEKLLRRARHAAAEYRKSASEIGASAASRPRCRVPSGQLALPAIEAAAGAEPDKTLAEIIAMNRSA